jgi:hypothetical protein
MGDILHALREKGYTSLVGCDISKELILLAGKSLPKAKRFVADMIGVILNITPRGGLDCSLILECRLPFL